MNTLNGSDFLNKIYKDLYLSNPVALTVTKKNTKPSNQLEEYFTKLETSYNHFSQNINIMYKVKEAYYKLYVIKEENVPESYFELKKKIAFEQGLGHKEFTLFEKQNMIDTIINDQKQSLNTWINYLTSDEASIYPMWAKYWAFRGMLSIGTYDRALNKITKRIKTTCAPFIELNPEALALSMDVLLKFINNNDIESEEIKKLLDNGSFAKLYTYYIHNLTKKNDINSSNEGRWVKYNQDSDYKIVINDIQGYNTGWCTAGEDTAKKQIHEGDFYIYYTKDHNNLYKVPRIAIRMSGSQIAEVRGIGPHQNLEEAMTNIVDTKLDEFSDKERFKQKTKNMYILTNIYNKFQNKIVLDTDDLKFLYQIDYRIEGFGHNDDPRIKEILSNRNFVDDLTTIFNCKNNQIMFKTSDEDVISEDIICYVGDINLDNNKIKHLPKVVLGSIKISNFNDLNNLVLPNTIGGSLILENISNISNLNIPNIMDSFYIYNASDTKISNLTFNKLGNHIELENITSISDIKFPSEILGKISANKVVSASNIKLPDILAGSLLMPNLKEANNIIFPSKMSGHLDLSQLEAISNLKITRAYTGKVNLNNLISTNELEFEDIINCELFLNKITEFPGLASIKEINKSIYLDNINSSKPLIFPKRVMGSISLKELVSGINLVLPEIMDGALHLNKLEEPCHIKLPLGMSELNLSSLTKLDNLVIPNMTGKLNLKNLVDPTNLNLDSHFLGSIDLSSIKDINQLNLPNIIDGELILGNVVNVSNIDLSNNTINKLSLPNTVVMCNTKLPFTNSDIVLPSLKHMENVVFNQNDKKIIYLNSLITAKNVIFPNRVKKLIMSKVEELDNVILPKESDTPLMVNAKIR